MLKKEMQELEKKAVRAAWKARKFAYPWKSGTKVGCAIVAESGKIITGWNIEGLWMTSIHAEVCAILQLVKLNKKGKLIAIVSKTKFFTPCGACLDWLFQFCSKDTPIVIENGEHNRFRFTLEELCPQYPQR